MLNEIIDLVARRRGYQSPEDVDRAIEDAKLAEWALVQEAKAASRTTQSIVPLAIAAASGFSPFLGTVPDRQYQQLADSYKGWVYTCIDKIAKNVAKLPLRLYVYRNRGGQKILNPVTIKMQIKEIKTAGERKYALKQMGVEKEEVLSHPFLTLIHRPNSVMTRFMLWYETILRMELGGQCGWMIERNGLGLPAQIKPLPMTRTGRLWPKVTPTMEIEYWSYIDGNVHLQIPTPDVVLMKYPHPASPFHAMSPLLAQTYPYDIDMFLLQQQRALFQNKGIPGIHLHTDSPFTKEQAKEIRDQVSEQWGSATQSGRPLITHSGLKADKAGWSNRDALLTEVSQDMRDRMITSYDMAPGNVGLDREVNRTTMEVLSERFITDCLGPKCQLIEEAIEAFMLPVYDQGLTLEFDLPDLGNREMELREHEMQLKNFCVTINEWRSREGLDSVPWGDKPWFSFGVTQDPEALGEPTPPPPAKEGEAEEKAAVATRARRWRQFISRQAPWERMVTSQMKGYFRNLGSEVIGRLNKLGPRVEAQYAGWSRKAVQEHIAKKGVGDDININKKTEAARLQLLVKPPVTALVEEGAKRILRELGVEMAFNVNDPKVAKWLGSRMDMFSEEVAGTTFDDIRAVLRQGFSDGKPLSVIADTLRETFDSYEKYRAPLIARTETIAASNKADLLAIRQAGIEEKVVKTWLTAGDENVRPTHQQAGEEYADGIPIDDMFQVGDDEMDAPGNGSDPAETINCFLPGTLVSGRFVAGLKARYTGPAREIKTAGGHRLSVTPNHPVLTSRGLIPAKDLRKGDALLGYHGELCFLPGVVGDADCKNGPSLIEDVFETFSANGRMLEAAADADLHGDARAVDGEIEIVTAKRMLTGNRKSRVGERAEDLILVPAHARESKMVSLGGRNPLAQRALSSRDGFPCGGTLTLDQPATLVDLGPFQPLCLGLAADWDIPLPKMEGDRASFDSKGISESLDALPGEESGNHLIDREDPATIRAGSLVPKRDAVVSKDHVERREAHSEFIQDLLDRSAGTVSFDEISEVRDFEFVGHVYDLQTDVGWMIAQGIVTSNCRCATGYEKA